VFVCVTLLLLAVCCRVLCPVSIAAATAIIFTAATIPGGANYERTAAGQPPTKKMRKWVHPCRCMDQHCVSQSRSIDRFIHTQPQIQTQNRTTSKGSSGGARGRAGSSSAAASASAALGFDPNKASEQASKKEARAVALVVTCVLD
jgi:hypothetical protein